MGLMTCDKMHRKKTYIMIAGSMGCGRRFYASHLPHPLSMIRKKIEINIPKINA
jgi:hypothetical protein